MRRGRATCRAKSEGPADDCQKPEARRPVLSRTGLSSCSWILLNSESRPRAHPTRYSVSRCSPPPTRSWPSPPRPCGPALAWCVSAGRARTRLRGRCYGSARPRAASRHAHARRRTPDAAPARPGPPIDEVVVTFFPAPHSYTAEDVVEISAHGSMALLREIVRGRDWRRRAPGRTRRVHAARVPERASRPRAGGGGGGPGDAVTPLQARVAFDQLEGTLTRAIGGIDAELFELSADASRRPWTFRTRAITSSRPGETMPPWPRARRRRSAAGHERRRPRDPRGPAHRDSRQAQRRQVVAVQPLVGTDRAIVAAGPGHHARHAARDDRPRRHPPRSRRHRWHQGRATTRSSRKGVARARGAGRRGGPRACWCSTSRGRWKMSTARCCDETASATRVVVVNKIDLPAAWARMSWKPGLGLRTRAAGAVARTRSRRRRDALRDVFGWALGTRRGSSVR